MVDNKEKLYELRCRKNYLTSKIKVYTQKGKTISDLQKEQNDILHQIDALTGKAVKSKTKPTIQNIKVEKAKTVDVSSKIKKILTKSELKKALSEAQQILESNDWEDNYQFRSSEWMFIHKPELKIEDNEITLKYVLQYKTKLHRVEKEVIKYFDPSNIQSLQKYIDDVELWMMLNSGDLDNKQLIFGKRFNKTLFDEQQLEQRGWKIYR